MVLVLPVVTDETFGAEVLGSSLPVLAYFRSRTSAQCLAMDPSVENLARRYAGRMAVVSVDIGSSRNTASAQDIHGVPAVVLYVDGAEALRVLGPQIRTGLPDLLDKVLP